MTQRINQEAQRCSLIRTAERTQEKARRHFKKRETIKFEGKMPIFSDMQRSGKFISPLFVLRKLREDVYQQSKEVKQERKTIWKLEKKKKRFQMWKAEKEAHRKHSFSILRTEWFREQKFRKRVIYR